jgi:hypothetical protein
MNAQAIALAIAAVLTVPMAILFKNIGFGKPEKAWIEFVVALVLALVASVATGQAWTALPFSDPVQFFTSLWSNATPVIAVALVVYVYFQDKIVDAVNQRRLSNEDLPF